MPLNGKSQKLLALYHGGRLQNRQSDAYLSSDFNSCQYILLFGVSLLSNLYNWHGHIFVGCQLETSSVVIEHINVISSTFVMVFFIKLNTM